MLCTDSVMKLTGYLHIVAILFAIFGVVMQINSIKHKKPFSPWLALSLTIMLLLRVPNQVCVARIHPHGWYSVIGTLIGAFGFGMLVYYSFKARNEEQPIEYGTDAEAKMYQQKDYVHQRSDL